MIAKLAPVVALDLLAAVQLDLNLMLNVLMLVIAGLVAVPLVKSRRKDGTIKDMEAAYEAACRRRDEALRDLQGATARANVARESSEHLRNELAAANARYEEQEKYTAKGAVTHMEEILIEHRDQVAERHELMLEALNKLTARLENGKG